MLCLYSKSSRSARIRYIHADSPSTAYQVNMSFSRNKPLQPSFGVEWEGLVAVADGKYVDAEGKPVEQLFKDVANQTLNNNGIPARANGLDRMPRYDRWTIMPDTSIYEETLCAERPSGRQFLGIEAVSPVLKYASLEDASLEIKRVLRALNRACGPIQVNGTTGLHIHVGTRVPGKTAAAYDHFPLPTVKNLALLVIALEHVLNSVIPEERLGLTVEPEYVKPFSLLRRTLLPRHYAKSSISIWDQLEAVNKADSNAGVVHAVQADNRFVHVNFHNLPDDPSILRTGEVPHTL